VLQLTSFPPPRGFPGAPTAVTPSRWQCRRQLGCRAEAGPHQLHTKASRPMTQLAERGLPAAPYDAHRRAAARRARGETHGGLRQFTPGILAAILREGCICGAVH
jgi:hypothetical protein